MLGLVASRGPRPIVRARDPLHPLDHAVEILVQQLERRVDDLAELLIRRLGRRPGRELALQSRASRSRSRWRYSPARVLEIRRRDPLRETAGNSPGTASQAAARSSAGARSWAKRYCSSALSCLGIGRPARLERQPGEPAGRPRRWRRPDGAGNSSPAQRPPARQDRRRAPACRAVASPAGDRLPEASSVRDEGEADSAGRRDGRLAERQRSSTRASEDRVLIGRPIRTGCLQRAADPGQVGQHLGGRLVAVGRVLGHQLEHQPLELRRESPAGAPGGSTGCSLTCFSARATAESARNGGSPVSM